MVLFVRLCVLWQPAGLVFATASTPETGGNLSLRARCSSMLELLPSTGTIPMADEQTIILLLDSQRYLCHLLTEHCKDLVHAGCTIEGNSAF